MIKFRWITLVNRQEKEREVDPEIFDRTVCPLSLSLSLINFRLYAESILAEPSCIKARRYRNVLLGIVR